MFVLFTLLKVALDERKTLTKISTRNLTQLFPQTSARFGPDEIRKPVESIWQKAFCIIGGESEALGFHQETTKELRQQTEMTENSTRTSGSVLYKTLHYFSNKFCFISFIYAALET